LGSIFPDLALLGCQVVSSLLFLPGDLGCSGCVFLRSAVLFSASRFVFARAERGILAASLVRLSSFGEHRFPSSRSSCAFPEFCRDRGQAPFAYFFA
jgi:hypothetical protein